MSRRAGEEVPPRTAEMFPGDEESSLAMTVQVGTSRWTTAVPTPTDIDFQGDPREVRDRADLEHVLAFMRQLHEITERPVVLVTETLSPREAKPYLSVGSETR